MSTLQTEVDFPACRPNPIQWVINRRLVGIMGSAWDPGTLSGYLYGVICHSYAGRGTEATKVNASSGSPADAAIPLAFAV